MNEGLESLSQGWKFLLRYIIIEVADYSFIDQKEIMEELKSWKEPLESIAMQVTDISDTANRNLVVSEGISATVGKLSDNTDRILSGKNILGFQGRYTGQY